MSEEFIINKYNPNDMGFACGCQGPRDNEPVCPCAMIGMSMFEGRWIRIIDYGPIEAEKFELSLKEKIRARLKK